MRSMAKYLEKAAEFERLAGETQDPVLQARFSNIAGCYRLLASEREWLIETGVLETSADAVPKKPKECLEFIT